VDLWARLDVVKAQQRGRNTRTPLTRRLVLGFIQMTQSLPNRSCPDLVRASTETTAAVPRVADGRDKPGHKRMSELTVRI